MDSMKPPTPARWKYGILIETCDSKGQRMYCVFDRPGGEREPYSIPEHRKFITLDEAKQYIEAYEKKEGYAID